MSSSHSPFSFPNIGFRDYGDSALNSRLGLRTRDASIECTVTVIHCDGRVSLRCRDCKRPERAPAVCRKFKCLTVERAAHLHHIGRKIEPRRSRARNPVASPPHFSLPHTPAIALPHHLSH